MTDGEGRDPYDDLRQTKLLAIAGSGQIAGCVRLLPASGSIMLEQTFPQFLETDSLAVHSGMVKGSPPCFDITLISLRDGANYTLRHSPCSPASSNGRRPAATGRSSRRPIPFRAHPQTGRHQSR
ncbi:acyl-homoserine-lactone synthase [Agrobacterium tumefaciens]|uniref:acyl-homoserine-lactone synthase n=1 Tax=Agrobacterium tumefaciens TaxID=358 RepID=UPI00307AC1D3